MTPAKLMTALVALMILSLAAPLDAGQRHGGSGFGGHSSGGAIGHGAPRTTGGHAVPRSGGVSRYAVPRGGVHSVPSYRTYGYYPYYHYPTYGLGFFYGYPGYYSGYYGHGLGYPWYGYGAYGYGYGGYGYGYGYPGGYVNAAPSWAYGRVHIEGAPREAEVFVDGYYAGIVDDFDGVRQYLTLEPGVHQIDIVGPDLEPSSFDVNVQPGQTITLRAPTRSARP